MEKFDNAILENELKIRPHEYNLKQFIHIAIRYNIEGVRNTVYKNHEYSLLLEGHIKLARDKFEDFKIGLKDELIKAENWKAIKIDIEHRFIPMIEEYFKWYKLNEQETKDKFGNYNPYELMYELMISTIQEIQKYFLENSKPAAGKLKKITPKTLSDIWQGTKEQYNTVIDGLKKEYRPIGMPFVEEKQGTLTWNKHPKKGFVQYVKAFLYECIQKGWIKKTEYSGNQFKVMVKNTFNIDVNPEPFKTMQNSPGENYIKPFKSMPKNENSQNS